MGRDNNAIFGYGFVLRKIDYDIEMLEDETEYDEDGEILEPLNVLEDIENFCQKNKLKFIHDMYWSDYEIFIGIVKHKVQNGVNTHSKNGWNSKKDKLTDEVNITFEISENEKKKIDDAYNFVCRHNEEKPRWRLFTFNT